MSKILVAEDDQFLRDILKDYLEENGHKVTAVPDGKIARDIVLAADFDLVISDVQMPHFNGVDLLGWLRTKSKIPFILMTGFANLLETHTAAELGANGFLSKPFSNKELMAIIDELLQAKPVTPASDLPSTHSVEYCKVSISEFVTKPKLDYDLYICLQQTRYLKIAKTGETLDVHRLDTYRIKGLQYFYLRKDDFKKLVDFNLQITRVIQQNQSISSEKKLQFMRYTSEVVMEHCFVDGVNRESLKEANDFLQTSMGLFVDNNETLSLLDVLNNHSDSVYAHSLGVALFSVMIAKHMEYTSTQTLFRLAMAALFHDIGKKEIPKIILEKPRPLLSQEERILYESHVQRGRDIMLALPNISDDVIQIIYEHHEDEIGQGYPNSTSRMRMHPLSCIVHVADLFVNHVVKNPNHNRVSPEEAVGLLEKYESGRIEKTAFNALKNLIIKQKAA